MSQGFDDPTSGTAPDPSYSITLRVQAPTSPRLLPMLTELVSRAGAIVVAVDIVDVQPHGATVDVSFYAHGTQHVGEIARSLAENGYRVHHVSDRTFIAHLGGTIRVMPKVPIRTRDDLSIAYTPGVPRIASAIASDPESAWNLSIKGNSVAILTNGTAVLGLGNLGPRAALPVMEGKAALFQTFGGVNAFPLCIESHSVEDIVSLAKMLEPTFGGINLEDIAAPECFEIERRLQEELQIPVFHDDQHGTAIVVHAGLLTSCRLTGRTLENLRVVVVGIGAAGHAICETLLDEGVKDLVAVDTHGPLLRTTNLPPHHASLALRSNPNGVTTIEQAMRGADVFIGVAKRGSVDPALFATMAPAPIIFALSNPEPEAFPNEVPPDAVLATGRSDLPNQVNNALCFPGFFRGALDARARMVTPAMKRAAAHALASAVSDDQLSLGAVIPSLFQLDVHRRVAEAVQGAAASEVR